MYPEPGSCRYPAAMTARADHIDFDELMRVLTVVGFVALAAWVMASGVGVLSGYVVGLAARRPCASCWRC